MNLWQEWWRWCMPLRNACSRTRTFLWMCTVLIGFCVREDLRGVTSVMNVFGLSEPCYDRMLDFLHSNSLDVGKLMRIWVAMLLKNHPGLLRFNGKPVLVGDGIKVGKAGKRMPGVKRLHQVSESNTKPTYILGHSCQAVSILARGQQSVVSIPLTAKIHEGVVFSNRCTRTLLDKMIDMLDLLKIDEPYYFVADAYYASKKIIVSMMERECHLITRARNNAVAFLPVSEAKPDKRGKGRPRLYGNKVSLRILFEWHDIMQTIPSPVYGETDVQLKVWTCDLVWRPVGILVRFVAVSHPTRGRLILISTDLSLTASQIIELYGYRFKIEVNFKRALHDTGAFHYHFWMKNMTPVTRKAKDQHLHRNSQEYRDAVRRKLDTYHRFIQLGLIAQGIMCVLATTVPELIHNSFGSYFRTIRTERAPSEAMVAKSLQNTLHQVFDRAFPYPLLAAFLKQRLDPCQTRAQWLMTSNDNYSYKARNLDHNDAATGSAYSGYRYR